MKKSLHIKSFGVFIGATGERFKISTRNGKKDEVPAINVESIMFHGYGGSISTKAIRLTCKYRIPVFFLDNRGIPYSMIAHLPVGGTVKTRREQYLAFNDGRGFELSKWFVLGKLSNQAKLLRKRAKWVKNRDPKKAHKLREYASGIRKLMNEVNALNTKASNFLAVLRGLEAKAAREFYWRGFSLLLPDGFSFLGRAHRGARDPVNCLLNYGYGVLMGRVSAAVILAGLDPYAGFLHSDRPGKPSMVLDLMEEFRQPIVDSTLLSMLNLGELKPSEVLEADEVGDVRLSSKALTILLFELESKFEKMVQVNDKRIPMRNVILRQARMVAAFLRGQVKSYKPFDW